MNTKTAVSGQSAPKELCSLAAQRDGRALQYVPPEMQDENLCRQAVYNSQNALEYVREDLKIVDICRTAIQGSGSTIEFVPEKQSSRRPPIS
jgi:hypothetical protein